MSCVGHEVMQAPKPHRGNAFIYDGTAVESPYAWDRDNRLRSVTLPVGIATSYNYDANGFRTQRVDAAGTTRYLLDGASVLQELDAANTSTNRFLNNPQVIDEVLAYQRGSTTEYPLTDALGSIYAATDSSGAVVHRYDFDVYGVRADLGGNAAAIDIGFTGRWHDANGLVEHRDRQRKPSLGGWLQPDRLNAAVSASDVAQAATSLTPTEAWRFGADIGREVANALPQKNGYAYPAAPASSTDPSGLCASEDWWATSFFYVAGKIAPFPVGVVAFGGIYFGLDSGSQIGVLSILLEGGKFFPASPPGFHAEFGIGVIGFETHVPNDVEAFRGGFIQPEGVLQYGPVVDIFTEHGQAVFITSERAIGTGVLLGSNKLTFAWRVQ